MFLNKSLKIERSKNFKLAEEFLQNNFSSPTHWPEWNIVVSKHFGTNFYYLFAYENEKLIGICPIHEEKKGIITNYFSGQFNYISYGGWIFSKDNQNEFHINILRPISNFQAFFLPELPEFNYKSIIKNLKVNKFKTLIIDLSLNLEDIWNNSIDSKRRNKIRKAERHNIRLEIMNNNFSNIWYDLYLEANNRNHLKILSNNFFYELFSVSKNISFLVVNAYLADEIISNAIIAYDKNYSIYWLGNNSKKYNYGQSELIQFEVIKKMKEFGCKYYDLCYIEKERLPNIYEFKKGFSNWEVDIPLISRRTILFRVYNRIKKCF